MRRYATNIERALASWEVAPEEWADYIAFLSRLLKAIQSAGADVPTLPHSGAVASKLAQCINPGLPSGVHQKALEVYGSIFSRFGEAHVAARLHEYLPGLFPLLSYASLSVRPALYSLLEGYVVCLPPADLRPVLKSLILSVLPALEDESSEDFDRALGTLERLEERFVKQNGAVEEIAQLASFFWQSVFLSVITSIPRRQGGLNYLIRRLPKFEALQRATGQSKAANGPGSSDSLSSRAEAAISPDPGLLIRSFACGLSDAQSLVQRGFLDLLVSHLPLSSPVLQHRIRDNDYRLLMSAAIGVLLRRDMSLNRRVWQWLLGPESKEDGGEITSPNDGAEFDAAASKQLQYFLKYGMHHLEQCILANFAQDISLPVDRARAFRICLSLMDRWEIGGNIIPRIFLPAMRSAYTYSRQQPTNETAELMKSASLFFDGVESRLIWCNLFELFSGPKNPRSNADDFALLLWVVGNFNVKEEEMLIVHAPLAVLYMLNSLGQAAGAERSENDRGRMLDTISALLNIIPSRAFAGTDDNAHNVSSPAMPSTSDLQGTISSFYQDDGLARSQSKSPISSALTTDLLIDLSIKVFTHSMESSAEEDLSTATNVLLQILTKLPKTKRIPIRELLRQVRAYLSRSSPEIVTFVQLNSTMSLLLSLPSLPQADHDVLHEGLLELEPFLSPLLWRFLSTSNTKQNVEAVKLLWQLDSLLKADEAVKASLHFLVQSMTIDSTGQKARVENIRTFLNLWVLSLVSQPSLAKTAAQATSRKSSSATLPLESETGMRRIEVLGGPLMIALDVLRDPANAAFEDVTSWLNNSQYAGTVCSILCEKLDTALRDRSPSEIVAEDSSTSRSQQQAERALIYVLEHLDRILQNGNFASWSAFGDTQWPGLADGIPSSASIVLADRCLKLLAGAKGFAAEVHRLAASILGHLLSGPTTIKLQLQPLDITKAILNRLLDCIRSPHEQIQCSMLRLAALSLTLRRVDVRRDENQTRASLSMQRPSSSHGPSKSSEEIISVSPVPIALLVQVLRAGFSAQACYPYLDSWLEFHVEAIPALGDSLASSLIPLTETICAEVQKVFKHLTIISAGHTTDRMFSPETSLVRLLDSLSVILSGAYDFVLREDMDAAQAQAEPSSTMLGSVTPNIFRAQGPPSKTAKANNRLTVILASKDVVRTCVRIWLWASHGVEEVEVDRRSAATSAHNGTKLRNRTRHMLEEIFSVEPLESLEVVISMRSEASTLAERDAVMSLLHVLRGLRPKNTIPVILDALCSRTNPIIMVPSRQSTLTSELTAADVVLFFSAYLDSLEDDALDEIWSDCTAFLRDVLSNPLPYRQVLPALLWVTLQLALKLDNTNYGEQRRMRRELGDSFQRLLAATFTALPSGSWIDKADPGADGTDQETELVVGMKEMNLVVVLRDVITRIESILETQDRITSCVNNISTNVISPLIRSKTFPARVNADVLVLLQRMCKKSPAAKSWRKDITEAFNDARFMASPVSLVESYWFPVLQFWSLMEKERMPELFSRLSAPSSAGIMFGVGANAARLDADRKTQLNLRRISLLLLAAPTDSYVEHMKVIEVKMEELFEASATSSPSTAIKAELFMLCRALILSTSAVHFAPSWPVVNEHLQSALLSLSPDATQNGAQNNLSLLQACKLLDLLAAVAPDDFQLHEWIYITNTSDAVYRPPDWAPAALSDQLAEQLGQMHNEESFGSALTSTATPSQGEGRRGPILTMGSSLDVDDVKAMAPGNFVNAALRPFLSQLSIYTYESKYRMDSPDIALFKQALLEDVLDLGTVVS